MRKKFTKSVCSLFLLFGLATTLCGCAKDVVQPVAINREKMERIERFISIMWEVPKKDIVFDNKNNEYIFGQFKFDIERMEYLYDTSNNYKAKYENNK
ncbi:hypothetical protein [Pedobacter sp. UYP1]|uniref:hypothetical protein n=1 Tax=Pedobacter sp. UYP1 TaxID=1756396 RepID=UPI003390FF14